MIHMVGRPKAPILSLFSLNDYPTIFNYHKGGMFQGAL